MGLYKRTNNTLRPNILNFEGFLRNGPDTHLGGACGSTKTDPLLVAHDKIFPDWIHVHERTNNVTQFNTSPIPKILKNTFLTRT